MDGDKKVLVRGGEVVEALEGAIQGQGDGESRGMH
jgi:hypothetical protein